MEEMIRIVHVLRASVPAVDVVMLRLDFIPLKTLSLVMLITTSLAGSTHDIATSQTEPVDSTKIQPLDSTVKQ